MGPLAPQEDNHPKHGIWHCIELVVLLSPVLLNGIVHRTIQYHNDEGNYPSQDEQIFLEPNHVIEDCEGRSDAISLQDSEYTEHPECSSAHPASSHHTNPKRSY